MAKFNRKRGNTLVAVAIIVAGLIIAGAVMFTNNDNGGSSVNNGQAANPNNSAEQAPNDLSGVREPNEDDHIKGSLDAPIIVIEYSDTECPFCGRLHNTLDDLVEEYDGQVAWVYRHLPLAQIHPTAPAEAHATECAAELGGNEGFWKFTDRLYEVSPGNNRFDLNELPNIAEFAGLDRAAFEACQEEERHLDKVREDFEEGVAATSPNLGTPFNVVIAPDGTKIAVSGAQPKEAWTTMFDQMLAE
jgi:protein-disulfide isomerase